LASRRMDFFGLRAKFAIDIRNPKSEI
jgi:hypothetical protein